MNHQAEILVHVSRGKLVESVHRGHAAVVDTNGNHIKYCGDPDHITYMRSASKPLQALAVIVSGAAERFKFTDRELAVMSASHYGESFHRETVQSILDKIGLDKNNLRCGVVSSLNAKFALKNASEGFLDDETVSDCSGKHAGFLSLCVHGNYSYDNYEQPDHPVQQYVLSHICELLDLEMDQVSVGIDGCSVPVIGFPLSKMALSYALLANSSCAVEKYRTALSRLYNAMVTYPEMVSGTGGFCTELIKSTKGSLVGKVGAEGIYCIGIKDAGLGFALKIEDGNFRAVWPTAMEGLRQLNILHEPFFQTLNDFHFPPVKNDLGDVVGKIEPVFTFKDS